MGAAKDLWYELDKRFCEKDWAGLTAFYAEDALHVDPVGRHEGRDAIGAYWEEWVPKVAAEATHRHPAAARVISSISPRGRAAPHPGRRRSTGRRPAYGRCSR
jgi:hypothetical protein